MAIDQTHPKPDASVKEQAGDLIHDLTTEMKEEAHQMRYGEQPVTTHADLTVRRHVMGIIIMLFGLVALILVIGIAIIRLHGPLHR